MSEMQSSAVRILKQALRVEMRRQLKAMPDLEREKSSAAVVKRIAEMPIWSEAKQVLLYVPMKDEPDIWPLSSLALDLGKSMYFPRYNPVVGHYEIALVTQTSRITQGNFGVMEPGMDCPAGDINSLDLALVPGLSFDRLGRRLGRGKGFYDRLLASARMKKCGVGFGFQLVSEVPAEDHDILLDYLLTPDGWFELRPHRF